MVERIARWDLDKTYLRTEFGSVRDLLRTALELADEKRTNPGARALLRELGRCGSEIHILSGSPEQLRARLEQKLRLDGIEWASFTLKPNLQNLLRLRFRAVRDQLGYKLPRLLSARAKVQDAHKGAPLPREVLFGDDAEADAFIYALYSDILRGRVTMADLAALCVRARLYPDDAQRILSHAAALREPGEPVERILIHLEGQTPPSAFFCYGAQVVPFYNYLQAAFALQEDSAIDAQGVLAVAVELTQLHRFDAVQLSRSYRELALRGHLRGSGGPALRAAFERMSASLDAATRATLGEMLQQLTLHLPLAQSRHTPIDPQHPPPNYLELVLSPRSGRR